MLKMSLQIAGLLALLAVPLAGQQPQVEVLPETRTDSPQTFVEQSSPASFGSTVITGSDGHLQVTDVVEGSAAAEGGLLAGDHIISVNGKLLTEPSEFSEYVAGRPTIPLTIVVLRDGIQKTILVSPPDGAATTPTTQSRPALGVRFMRSPLVIVGETVAGSPAASAGLTVGDQIISVNGEPISSSDQFITLVAAAPLDEPLTLGFVRGAERSTVSIVPAAWDTVFTSTEAYTTLKPVVPDATAPAVVPVIGYRAYAYPWYNPYYISNVSPVVVPLTWYGYYPSGYAYWNVPYYYGYYPGYFYYSAWPNGPYYYYGGPYPGPVYDSKPGRSMDSASGPIGGSSKTVSRMERRF